MAMTVLCFNSPNLISSFIPVSTFRKSSVRAKLSSRSPLVVTCEDHQDWKVHRRGLILGGGLTGALSTADSIHAAPVQAPDMVECDPAIVTKPATVDTPVKWERCCPPKARGAAIEFKKDDGPMRVRRAAHKLSPDYIAKYNLAYQKMRELDKTDPRDPRGFKQQSKVHCAYCNYAYSQQGDDKKLQIHFSWLFLPWHRFYLHFHEKILGSLINDPEFALPFWNWDNRTGGGVIPSFFMDKVKYAALHDENRDEKHLNIPVPLGGTSENDNLNVMHQSVAVVKDGLGLMGGVYRRGDRTPLFGNSGSLEIVHNAAHVFAGNPNQPYGEDMGNFYTAARDPLFYCHHSNVDRLWTVWKEKLGNTDFVDPDFLDTEFLFFDEKTNLVKCKVRDSLDSESNFKYTFDDVPEDNNWISYEPPRSNPKPSCGTKEYPELGPASRNSTPMTITCCPVVVTVKQPKDSGGKDEVLVLENVTIDTNGNTGFRVFINFPTAKQESSLNCMEYVGSFSNLPHFITDTQAMKRTTNARFSIKYNVGKLNLTGCDLITVTIVPDPEAPSFTIQGASIMHT